MKKIGLFYFLQFKKRKTACYNIAKKKKSTELKLKFFNFVCSLKPEKTMRFVEF